MDVFFLDLTLKKFLRDTTASFHVNQILSLREAIDILLEKEYTYDAQLDRPGTYRQQGDVLEIFPIFRQEKVRVSFFDTYIDGIFCVSAR